MLLVFWASTGVSPVEAQRLEEPRAEWIGAATMLGTAVLLDDLAQQHLSVDGAEAVHEAARVGNLLGRGKVAVLVLAGAAGAGRVTGLEELSHPVEHTLIALVAAGAVSGAVKVSVGRQRPDGDDETARFRVFNLDDQWQSFPSGHAVTAFAIAAALSEELRRPWVTGLAFGAAGLVGWSRIHENRHWTSDVVAGALVGTLTARHTVRHLHRGRGGGGGDPVLRGSGWAKVRVAPIPAGFVVSVATR